MRLFFLLDRGLLRLLSAETDRGNLDPGQLPPMPDRAMVPFPAAIFERDDLLVLALLDHFAGHGRTLNEGTSMGNLVAIHVKKSIREHTLFAGFFIEEIDIDDVSLRDAVLSAASFNNCVSHTKSRVLSGGKAAQSSTDASL